MKPASTAKLEHLPRHRIGLVGERAHRVGLDAVREVAALERDGEGVRVDPASQRHVGAAGDEPVAEERARAGGPVQEAVRGEVVVSADGRDADDAPPARHQVGDHQPGVAE